MMIQLKGNDNDINERAHRRDIKDCGERDRVVNTGRNTSAMGVRGSIKTKQA